VASRSHRMTILNPVRGEDDRRFPNTGYLGPNTINVYPDHRGWLRGYRGNQALLSPEPAAWAGKNIVEAQVFVNRLGVKRRVFITDDWGAWSLDDQVPNLLFQFTDKVRMVQFQDLVIFLSKTQAPRKWDGIEAVTYLGVREIPQAPTVRVAGVAHNQWAKYFRKYISWGINNESEPMANAYVPSCATQDRNPIEDDQLQRMYDWAISFYNTRGQIGRRSKATTFVVAAAGDILLDRSQWTPAWDRNNYNFLYPIVEWATDFEQEDIAGVIVWRTINQFVAEEAGLLQLAYAFPLPLTRVTDRKADGALTVAYDEGSGYPGPQGLIATTFRDNVLIAGDPENPRIVRWCTGGFPEDWPILNAYQAQDEITALVSLSKSVVVVTRSSIETIALNDAGIFVRARVEATKGSIYGETLIQYKDNVVGIWNSGFGVFDGFTFKQMNNTTGHLIDEIEPDSGAFSWVHDSMLFIRTQTRGRGPQILVYHFAFNAWFRLDGDNVFCAWIEDDDVFVGAADTLRAFNKSATGSGVIEFRLGGFEEGGRDLSWMSKEILRLFFYFGSTGNWNYTVNMHGDERYSRDPFFSGKILAADKDDTFWDDARALWDSVFARWDAPSFKWRSLEVGYGGANFESASISITWTGDISLGGLAMEYRKQELSGR